MVILISDFSSEGDLFLFGCFLLFSGGTYNENGCLKKIFECQRPQPSGYNIGNTVCGPSGLTAIILQSGWAWVSLWSLTPGHPGLSVSKEFCLPIFWSRCRAILKFHAEICENTWLNWTVGSDCLLPEYWDSDMFWCIFSSQVNSFSFYFFFFFFFFFFFLPKSYPVIISRFPCPWNSPGKNTGVCSHSLLQGIFPTQGSNLDLLYFREIFTIWDTGEAYYIVLLLLLNHFSRAWLCTTP